MRTTAPLDSRTLQVSADRPGPCAQVHEPVSSEERSLGCGAVWRQPGRAPWGTWAPGSPLPPANAVATVHGAPSAVCKRGG